MFLAGEVTLENYNILWDYVKRSNNIIKMKRKKPTNLADNSSVWNQLRSLSWDFLSRPLDQLLRTRNNDQLTLLIVDQNDSTITVNVKSSSTVSALKNIIREETGNWKTLLWQDFVV